MCVCLVSVSAHALVRTLAPDAVLQQRPRPCRYVNAHTPERLGRGAASRIAIVFAAAASSKQQRGDNAISTKRIIM